MKKIYFLIVMLAIASIAFSSCKKAKTNYCAACVEANSGYRPSDFCGTEAEVDTYISELKTQGAAANQNWSCDKN